MTTETTTTEIIDDGYRPFIPRVTIDWPYEEQSELANCYRAFCQADKALKANTQRQGILQAEIEGNRKRFNQSFHHIDPENERLNNEVLNRRADMQDPLINELEAIEPLWKPLQEKYNEVRADFQELYARYMDAKAAKAAQEADAAKLADKYS